MAAGIWGVLAALPQLLLMIREFITWINKVSGNDPAGFAVKASAAFSQLNNAKTQEDHQNAAKAISDLIASMPH